MLLFRDEEHAAAWRSERGIDEGATMPLETGWALAKAWYASVLEPDWHWMTAGQARSMFAALGLSGPFWDLPDETSEED